MSCPGTLITLWLQNRQCTKLEKKDVQNNASACSTDTEELNLKRQKLVFSIRTCKESEEIPFASLNMLLL